MRLEIRWMWKKFRTILLSIILNKRPLIMIGLQYTVYGEILKQHCELRSNNDRIKFIKSFELAHDKTSNIWSVLPAKIQINMGIHPI